MFLSERPRIRSHSFRRGLSMLNHKNDIAGKLFMRMALDNGSKIGVTSYLVGYFSVG